MDAEAPMDGEAPMDMNVSTLDCAMSGSCYRCLCAQGFTGVNCSLPLRKIDMCVTYIDITNT